MQVYVTDGHFIAYPQKSSRWTHIVLNYIGPENGQGIRNYNDGAEVESDTTKNQQSFSPGDGRIVVGRFFTDRNQQYASVQVDELIFFNRTLTSAEVNSVYNSA